MGDATEGIRVVLADDNAAIRESLRRILGKEADIHIVAEAANGPEAVRAVRIHAPHVLVLDMNMPVMSGLEVIKKLAKEELRVRVLVIGIFVEPYYINSVLRSGADGYIPKEAVPEQLAEAVRQVIRGKQTIPELWAENRKARVMVFKR